MKFDWVDGLTLVAGSRFWTDAESTFRIEDGVAWTSLSVGNTIDAHVVASDTGTGSKGEVSVFLAGEARSRCGGADRSV